MGHIAAEWLHFRNDLIHRIEEVQGNELHTRIDEQSLDWTSGRDDNFAPVIYLNMDTNARCGKKSPYHSSLGWRTRWSIIA
jgi:hypothetical protein